MLHLAGERCSKLGAIAITADGQAQQCVDFHIDMSQFIKEFAAKIEP
jgi:hypothetical protein